MSKKIVYRWAVGVTDETGKEHLFAVDAPSRGNAEYQALRTILSQKIVAKRPPRNNVRSKCLGRRPKPEPVDPNRGDW